MQFERKIVLPEVTVLFLGFENMPHWKARERSGLWHFSYSSSLITENGDSFSWNSDRQLSQLLGFCGEGFQWCNWQIQLPCQHKQVKVKLGRKKQNFTLVAEALISQPGYQCRQTPMCVMMEIGAVYHRPWTFRETWLLPCLTSLCQLFWSRRNLSWDCNKAGGRAEVAESQCLAAGQELQAQNLGDRLWGCVERDPLWYTGVFVSPTRLGMAVMGIASSRGASGCKRHRIHSGRKDLKIQRSP